MNVLIARKGFSVGILSLLLTAAIAGELRADKPRVAVVDFAVKVPRAHNKLGSTMSDLLVDALLQTDRYIVLERDMLDKLRQEQKLTLSGEVDAATGAEFGRLTGAGYLIVGAVTKFEEKQSGGGIGGLLSKKVLGGATWYTSELGITVRIIDATTGVIAASEKVNKKERSIGLAALTNLLGTPAAGGLFKSASMQTALEKAISECAEIISKQIPSSEADSVDSNLARIQLLVSGVNFQTLRTFTNMLEKVDGVEGLTKELSDGKAAIDIRYNGTAEELADAIYTAKTENMNFEIIGLADRRIDIGMK